jgi:hypothetical protein
MEKVKHNLNRGFEFLRTMLRKNSSGVLREYWRSIEARM